MAYRFKQPIGWIRLFVLGIVLIDFAVLALDRAIFKTPILHYLPGMASVFGGALISIIIIRVGRPKLYLDWIVLGSLHMLLGMLIVDDALLAKSSAFAAFFVLLLASAALTTWIGATLDAPDSGPAWIMAAGLTGSFCAGWLIVGPFVHAAAAPDVVLAVDLLLLGIAIAGFGLSLRKQDAPST